MVVVAFRDFRFVLIKGSPLSNTEYERQHVRDEGQEIYIKYPEDSNKWTIIFKRGVSQHTIVTLGTKYDKGPFGDRIKLYPGAMRIDPLQYEDSGTFEFRDVKDNLVERVELEVKTSEHQNLIL